MPDATGEDPPRVVVDERKCLPGRGAWVHPTATCLDLAVRRRAVPRALRVTAPLDLSEVRTTYVDKEAGQKPMGTR